MKKLFLLACCLSFAVVAFSQETGADEVLSKTDEPKVSTTGYGEWKVNSDATKRHVIHKNIGNTFVGKASKLNVYFSFVESVKEDDTVEVHCNITFFDRKAKKLSYVTFIDGEKKVQLDMEKMDSTQRVDKENKDAIKTRAVVILSKKQFQIFAKFLSGENVTCTLATVDDKKYEFTQKRHNMNTIASDSLAYFDAKYDEFTVKPPVNKAKIAAEKQARYANYVEDEKMLSVGLSVPILIMKNEVSEEGGTSKTFGFQVSIKRFTFSQNNYSFLSNTSFSMAFANIGLGSPVIAGGTDFMFGFGGKIQKGNFICIPSFIVGTEIDFGGISLGYASSFVLLDTVKVGGEIFFGNYISKNVGISFALDITTNVLGFLYMTGSSGGDLSMDSAVFYPGGVNIVPYIGVMIRR